MIDKNFNVLTWSDPKRTCSLISKSNSWRYG